MSTNLQKVGYIAGAHGIRGEVRVRPLTESAAALRKMCSFLKSDGTPLFAITFTGTSADHLIARVEGISTRNEAELLKGTSLYIPMEARPVLATDEWYAEDLHGMSAYTPSGDHIGKILSVQNFGAGDILEVELTSGKLEMYPFSKEVVLTVDIPAGRIVIEVPDMV